MQLPDRLILRRSKINLNLPMMESAISATFGATDPLVLLGDSDELGVWECGLYKTKKGNVKNLNNYRLVGAYLLWYN